MSLPHQTFAESRIMIMAAPNGARRNHDDHPALPLTVKEIAGCAAGLLEAGASVLHLHVRDNEGRHTLDVDRYRETINAVRDAVGAKLVIQATTEAVGQYRPDEQMALVRQLRPEGVSLALRELCADESRVATAARFFAWLQIEQIWPQYILYSLEDLQRFDTLRHRGVFAEERPNCLLVLGRYSEERQGETAELTAMLDAVDCTLFPWSVCCFGGDEYTAMLCALERGGHARIGFENNLLLADGSRASDNAALIAQFADAVARSPRQPATADDVRDALFSCRA